MEATCEELNSWSTCLAPFKYPSLLGRISGSARLRLSAMITHKPRFNHSFCPHARCRPRSLEDLVGVEHKAAAHITEKAAKARSKARPQRSWPGWRSADAPLQAGRRAGLSMTCCWSHAAAEEENPLDDREKMFAAEALGGAEGTRRSEAFKSPDPRVVLFLMTFHDAVLKSNSSGG